MNHRSALRLFAPLVLPVAVLLALALPSPALGEDSADCAICHENLVRTFETTIHGRIQGFETADGRTGCVTCHGDGAEHVAGEGDPAKIRGFDSETPAEEMSELCMSCHRSQALNDWHGSAHPLNGVGCNDCHKVHVAQDKAPRDPGVCWECHREVQAEFQYPSHHPLREGHLDCGSCHDPHGSSIGMLKTEERAEELCFSCHGQYQGPFVFEHEPVFEGCDTCHAPHGAVANNLLLQNEPFLCLQCHEMHFHAGLESEEGETVQIRRYDDVPDPGTDGLLPTDGVVFPDGRMATGGRYGYKRAFTTKCTQCHTEIHGSDSPSQTVPSMGRGLMR